jgi:hypothetical protein
MLYVLQVRLDRSPHIFLSHLIQCFADGFCMRSRTADRRTTYCYPSTARNVCGDPGKASLQDNTCHYKQQHQQSTVSRIPTGRIFDSEASERTCS